MKPLDFYQLGVRLANSGRTEAEHRAAIGRLYYGLHHEACCRYFRWLPLPRAIDAMKPSKEGTPREH